MQTISSSGERALIERIRARVPHTHPDLMLGIGDDAAVIRPARNRVQVITTDTIVEHVHFVRGWSTPREIGGKAVAVNVSDLGAMGSEPVFLTLSLALPDDLPLDEFDELIEGVAEAAREYKVAVAGGNITSTSGPITIDVTAIGTAHPRKMLRRDGARPGDDVYVTGTLGAGSAALMVLRSGEPPAEGSPLAATVRRACRPHPPVRAGVLLARTGASRAGTDLSDGLIAGLHQIAEASGCGFEVDPGSLPVDAGARLLDLPGLALSGDDYELLFTVSPRRRGRLRAAAKLLGTPITLIGKATEERGVNLPGLDLSDQRGFEHFREDPGTHSPNLRPQG